MTDEPVEQPIVDNPHTSHKKSQEIESVVGASRKMRRAIVIAILVYSAILIGTITYLGRSQPSNKILETIVTCTYSLCGTAIAGYMATATYQDRNYIPPKDGK